MAITGDDLMKAVGTAVAVVILAVISALIIGAILASDVFTSLTIINVTAIAELYGEFINGLLGFLGIIGIVLGVIWLIMYVAKLFSRGGLNDLGQTA